MARNHLAALAAATAVVALGCMACGCTTDPIARAKEECVKNHGGVGHVEKDGDVVCRDGVEIDVDEKEVARRRNEKRTRKGAKSADAGTR